jgi:hypothetical protein
MADTNRARALRGEVVRVSEGRLIEMQIQAIQFEGVTAEPVYHWHWAAVLNELVALRRIVAELARIRGIDLTPGLMPQESRNEPKSPRRSDTAG